MINGQPARSVRFFIDGNDPSLLPLVGDGLLPTNIDGKQKPMTDTAIPLVGTQDDGAFYGATFDALNIWDLLVKVRGTAGMKGLPRRCKGADLSPPLRSGARLALLLLDARGGS